MDDINADDAEFGMSDHKTHNELRAEIASLRTKLAEQTELSASALERCAELAERLAPLRAAARQDTGESRMRELNAKMLTVLRQIYAADVASLAAVKASGIWDFVRSPENERLVELIRAIIAEATEIEPPSPPPENGFDGAAPV